MNEQPRLIDIKTPLSSPVLDLVPVLALVIALVDPEGYAGSALVNFYV